MEFSGVCLVTDDVVKLSDFYKNVLHAELQGDSIHTVVKIKGTFFAVYSREASIKDLNYNYSKYNGYGNMHGFASTILISS